MRDALHEPWQSFFAGLDALLHRPTELHCLGGFVIAELYDALRVTADVDVTQIGGSKAATVLELAGKGSLLHRRHKVYIDFVTVASVPDGYEERLMDLVPRAFTQLRLRAFERHDLVLAKLTRNIDRDREDVKRLASSPGLDPAVLRERYNAELRYQMGNPAREDLTLELWLEMIAETKPPSRRS